MNQAIKPAALGCILLTIHILASAQTALQELQGQAKEAGISMELAAAPIEPAGKAVAPAESAIEYNAAGWAEWPKRHGYKFISMEYVPRSDVEKGKYNKVFVVKFKNKRGDVLISQYFKTHPLAFTIQKAVEKPYTIVDTKCRKVYDTKYPSGTHYEIPQCALDLYTTDNAGAYNPGQFPAEEQTGFVKLNTPEPDDFNPLDPDNPEPWTSPYFIKACEWHPVVNYQ